MKTRWTRYYKKQMTNPRMRELVEQELEGLDLGLQIAKLREAEKLSQTQLAARAEMSAPKISVIENKPKDVKIGTLIRIAHALDRQVEIRFLPKKAERVKKASRAASAA
ncbi:MAG TPA: helix-turn-helix transcriptional regulator [Terriglobia bacterium]|nr:helix-turn-helix transcriptional regulator [Terriglobia bacterium]